MIRAGEIPERPALAPWYRLVVAGERVLLEHGGSLVTLEGRAATVLLPALLARLDGSRTIPELVEELGTPVEAAVRNALTLLAANGLLLDGPAETGAAAREARSAALFVATGRRTSPRQAHAALAAADVAIAGSGAAGAEIARLLQDAGVSDVRSVELADDGSDSVFLVAVPEARETAELRSVNARRLATGAPWLQLLPSDGRNLVIGPLFVPGSSACHVCYGLRRAACSQYEEDYETLECVPTRAACPLALVAAAAGVAATVAIRWLAARDPTLPGRFHALETGPVLALSQHRVLRVPRCPACGPGDHSMPAPWYRESAVA